MHAHVLADQSSALLMLRARGTFFRLLTAKGTRSLVKRLRQDKKIHQASGSYAGQHSLQKAITNYNYKIQPGLRPIC